MSIHLGDTVRVTRHDFEAIGTVREIHVKANNRVSYGIAIQRILRGYIMTTSLAGSVTEEKQWIMPTKRDAARASEQLMKEKTNT